MSSALMKGTVQEHNGKTCAHTHIHTHVPNTNTRALSGSESAISDATSLVKVKYKTRKGNCLRATIITTSLPRPV